MLHDLKKSAELSGAQKNLSWEQAQPILRAAQRFDDFGFSFDELKIVGFVTHLDHCALLVSPVLSMLFGNFHCKNFFTITIFIRFSSITFNDIEIKVEFGKITVRFIGRNCIYALLRALHTCCFRPLKEPFSALLLAKEPLKPKSETSQSTLWSPLKPLVFTEKKLHSRWSLGWDHIFNQ